MTGLLLAGCGSRQMVTSTHGYARQQVLNWTESSNLATNDLSKATDTLSFNVLLNTEEGLYRLNKDGVPKPALAVNEKVSKDGKEYIFTLRKNARWSNGKPVTAHDFVTSWQRTLNPKTASQDAFYLYIIKNGESVNKGQLPVSDLGVHAIDNYQLKVSLSKPVTYFKQLLSWPLFFPLDSQTVNKYHDKYGTSSQYNVYDGPFKLSGWTGTNSQWSLVKNNHYWDRKHVHLTKINESVVESTNTGYELFNDNKVDETLLSGIQIKNNLKNPNLVKRLPTATSRLDLNQGVFKAFRNINIRRAISLAIDRKELTDNILRDNSVPSQGFVPNGMGKNPKNKQSFEDEAFVKNGVSYNLTQAKKLLAKGLKEEHLSNLTFSILGNNTDDSKSVLEFLQSEIEKIPHVKVEIVSVPFVQLIARQQHRQYDATLKSWQSVFADPINFLDIYESNSSYNNSGWKSNKFDRLINQSENQDANEPSNRWEDLVAAEKTLIQNQGTIPLYQDSKTQLIRYNIKNVVYNPSGVPYDWKTTYISR